MKVKIVIPALFIVLTGCVDMGTVGVHPATKTAYFSASMSETYGCLYAKASDQKHYMEEETPYGDGSTRYHLVHNGTDVAWLDIAKFGSEQTSVEAFYGRNEKGTSAVIDSMFKQCKAFLR